MSPDPSDPVLTEVLIDLDIDLLPILIRCGTNERILAKIPAPSPTRNVIPPRAVQKPLVNGRVETVARSAKNRRGSVIVGSWHLFKDLAEVALRGARGGGTQRVPQQRAGRRKHGDSRVGTPRHVGSRRTVGGTERTPVRLHGSKDAETDQTAGVGGATLPTGRRQRFAVKIDRGPRGVGIGGGGGGADVRASRNPSLPESKDPLAGCVRQDRRGLERTRVGNLLIPQYEEERLVPDDRAAEAERVLLRVSPVGLGGVPAGRSLSLNFAPCYRSANVVVAVPRIGIQRRVLDVPDCASRELVRSRPGA